MPKRYAVIGAGLSGIGATKCLLEQGFDVVVFDKTNYIGGLWHYHEDIDENGVASVMKSTVINTSKEVSSFSEMPPPAEYPNYMHNTLNIKYYQDAAAMFNFKQYVRFRHEVISVEMAPDYEQSGRWKVTFRDMAQSGPKMVEEDIFDGVAICVGHHNVRNEPTFPDQDKFNGKVMHTHSLKTAKGFEDKTVVVVGIGNSATDAAVELSTVTKQVYLSTRRGSWIFRRVGPNGVPFDTIFQRRILAALMSILPYNLICWFMERYLNSTFDHEKYQLKPKHRCLSAHITMNDLLPNKIMCGTVKVKGDIERFTENGVVFKGENGNETPCDVVILGTGYKVAIPFLSQDILPITRNKCRLYKHMFIPNISHPQTLGIIGMIQTVGAGIPAGELQCRFFAHLNAGKSILPSRDVMEADIDKKRKEIEAKYYDSDRHTFQTDWIPYMDELASEIGCKPPIWKYFFTDPQLFVKLVFGVAVSYQYRLVGPNSWSGAREAIMTVDERIETPFRTNSTRKEVEKTNRLISYTQMLVYGLFVLTLIKLFLY